MTQDGYEAMMEEVKNLKSVERPRTTAVKMNVALRQCIVNMKFDEGPPP